MFYELKALCFRIFICKLLLYVYIISPIRFWKLIEAGKENITQKDCKYILGVLAGLLGIDNADRAGIFKNATIEEYEKRQKFGDCGMHLVLKIFEY